MAFICRYSIFEYMVMPLGLTNVTANFQCLMSSVFANLLNEFLTVCQRMLQQALFMSGLFSTCYGMLFLGYGLGYACFG